MTDSSGVVARAGSIADGNIQKGNGPRKRRATDDREHSPSVNDHLQSDVHPSSSAHSVATIEPSSSCDSEEVSALRSRCEALEEQCRKHEEQLEKTMEELKSTKEDLAKAQKLLATAPRCSSLMEKLASVQAELAVWDAQMQNSDAIFERRRVDEEGAANDHAEANGQLGIEKAALRKEIEQLRAENDSLRMSTPSHPLPPPPPPPSSSTTSQPAPPNSQFFFGQQKHWHHADPASHELMMGLLLGRERPPVVGDSPAPELLMCRLRTIAAGITERHKIKKVTLELGYPTLTCRTCGTYISNGQMFLAHASSKKHMDLLKHPQYTSDVMYFLMKAERLSTST